MGGGDLNLKKSWHPHTMKNQEKVWKAEQAKNQEERKLKDLRKEIEDEKNRDELKRIGQASGVLSKGEGDKKLEWMYKNSTELINRDEYLLGRTIDKSFEMLEAEEQRKNAVGMKQPVNHVEHECIPFSIRAYRNMESTEQVDLQRKVMEDPLMLIKQREMESRRKLLENPVKLKELHRILKSEKGMKKLKKAKKSKKSKKSKKKKRSTKSSDESSASHSDSNSDSGKDLDKELEKRYKKLKGSLLDKEENLAGLNLSKLLDAKYETISKELDKAVESKKKSKKSHRSRSNSHDESERRVERRDERRSPEERRRREYRRQTRSRTRSPQSRPQQRYRDNNRYPRRYSRSRSPDRQDSRRPRRISRSLSPARQESRRQATRHSRSPAKQESRRPARSPAKSTQSSTAKRPSTKLTEEEKEARRREMMENAEWRETDRTQSVQKHREAYAREEQQNTVRDFDTDFINKEVKKAIANQTSVGSRIRANLNNIQRTSSAMNANFARK